MIDVYIILTENVTMHACTLFPLYKHTFTSEFSFKAVLFYPKRFLLYQSKITKTNIAF